MSNPFVIFWTVLIFASILWYGFLIFYIGIKGGKEIRELTRTLESSDRNPRERE